MNFIEALKLFNDGKEIYNEVTKSSFKKIQERSEPPIIKIILASGEQKLFSSYGLVFSLRDIESNSWIVLNRDLV